MVSFQTGEWLFLASPVSAWELQDWGALSPVTPLCLTSTFVHLLGSGSQAHPDHLGLVPLELPGDLSSGWDAGKVTQ